MEGSIRKRAGAVGDAEFEDVTMMVSISVNEDGYREVIGCAEGFTESKGNVISLSQIESRIRLGMKKTWSSAIGMIFSDQA